MNSIEKKNIGELIRQKRRSKEHDNSTLATFAEKLKKKGIVPMDGPRLSRLERGEIEDEQVYWDVCDSLNIDIPDFKTRLKVGFSQGFWAAPIIWINEQLATSEFFNQVELTCYTENETGNLIFNKEGKRLEPFDKNKHSFFYSGEIKGLISEGKIDIGFLGNTVVEDVPDIVRIARLVNANSTRHAMIVIAPIGTFSTNDKGEVNKEEVIDYLLKPKKPCYIYYHPNSTSEMEYRIILQHAGHEHDTLPVLNLPEFKEKFKEKVEEHEGSIVCQIGLMLSVHTAEEVVRELDPEGKKFQIIRFRTTKIVKALKKKGEFDMDVMPFYYEMVIKRDSEKIQKLAQSSEGFRLLLKLLREAVNKFDKIKNDKDIPLEHKKVANFFGLDKKKTSKILKKTEFELMFYPDWVNKALDIK